MVVAALSQIRSDLVLADTSWGRTLNATADVLYRELRAQRAVDVKRRKHFAKNVGLTNMTQYEWKYMFE